MHLYVSLRGRNQKPRVRDLIVWNHGQPDFLSLATLITRFEDAAVPAFVFGVYPAQPQPANRAMIAGGRLAWFIEDGHRFAGPFEAPRLGLIHSCNWLPSRRGPFYARLGHTSRSCYARTATEGTEEKTANARAQGPRLYGLYNPCANPWACHHPSELLGREFCGHVRDQVQSVDNPSVSFQHGCLCDKRKRLLVARSTNSCSELHFHRRRFKRAVPGLQVSAFSKCKGYTVPLMRLPLATP
jgi:hypothetical protein